MLKPVIMSLILIGYMVPSVVALNNVHKKYKLALDVLFSILAVGIAFSLLFLVN